MKKYWAQAFVIQILSTGLCHTNIDHRPLSYKYWAQAFVILTRLFLPCSHLLLFYFCVLQNEEGQIASDCLYLCWQSFLGRLTMLLCHYSHLQTCQPFCRLHTWPHLAFYSITVFSSLSRGQVAWPGEEVVQVTSHWSAHRRSCGLCSPDWHQLSWVPKYCHLDALFLWWWSSSSSLSVECPQSSGWLCWHW